MEAQLRAFLTSVQVEVSVQLDSAGALSLGKISSYALRGRLDGPRSLSGDTFKKEISLTSAGNQAMIASLSSP